MLFLVLQAYLRLIHFDLYLARGEFRGTLQQGPQLSGWEENGLTEFRRTDLLCGGHGLHLVLERSALPAAIGSDGMSS